MIPFDNLASCQGLDAAGTAVGGEDQAYNDVSIIDDRDPLYSVLVPRVQSGLTALEVLVHKVHTLTLCISMRMSSVPLPNKKSLGLTSTFSKLAW